MNNRFNTICTRNTIFIKPTFVHPYYLIQKKSDQLNLEIVNAILSFVIYSKLTCKIL